MALTEIQKQRIKEEEIFRLKVRRGQKRKRRLLIALGSLGICLLTLALAPVIYDRSSDSVDEWLIQKEVKLEEDLRKQMRARLGENSTILLDEAKRALEKKPLSNKVENYEKLTGEPAAPADLFNSDRARQLEYELQQQMLRARDFIEEYKYQRELENY